MNEIRELDCILNEEYRNVVAHDVCTVSQYIENVRCFNLVPKLPSSVYSRVANPCTSRAVSALPLLPATVENLTKVSVCFPAADRKDAAVMLDQSA